MKLNEYLAQEMITATEFAKMISVSRGMLHAYCSGKSCPRPATMALIVEVTEGNVRPEDMGYEITYAAPRRSDSGKHRKDKKAHKGDGGRDREPTNALQ